MDKTDLVNHESSSKDFKFFTRYIDNECQNFYKVISSPKYQSTKKIIIHYYKNTKLSNDSNQYLEFYKKLKDVDFSSKNFSLTFYSYEFSKPKNLKKLDEYISFLARLPLSERHTLVEMANVSLESPTPCEINEEVSLPSELSEFIEKITSIFTELKSCSKLEIFNIFLTIISIVISICLGYVETQNAERAHWDAVQAHEDAVQAHQDFITSQINDTDDSTKIDTIQNK